MTYALIVNGAVAQYPYSFAQLRRDNPQVSYPSDPSDEWLTGYGVHVVAPTAKPATTLTQNVVEATPVLVAGVWTQAWSVVPASAEEIAARQTNAADDAATTEIKADAFVTSFIAMTPAQVSTYVDNNTATLAAMRALVKKLAVMLLLLARREFR